MSRPPEQGRRPELEPQVNGCSWPGNAKHKLNDIYSSYSKLPLIGLGAGYRF
jgi:hypothetical protein